MRVSLTHHKKIKEYQVPGTVSLAADPIRVFRRSDSEMNQCTSMQRLLILVQNLPKSYCRPCKVFINRQQAQMHDLLLRTSSWRMVRKGKKRRHDCKRYYFHHLDLFLLFHLLSRRAGLLAHPV